MYLNYIRVALRNIRKYKLISFINTIGLAIGIAFAGLAFLFIRHEISYDDMHDPDHLIYNIATTVNNSINTPGVPLPLMVDINEKLPGVTSSLRMEERDIFILSGNEVFKERMIASDTNFLQFFKIPFFSNSKQSPLSPVNSIVLTPGMAKKYFGRTEVIGEVMEVILGGEKQQLQITAVIDHLPSNSSLDFQFVVPISTIYKNNTEALQDWHALPSSGFIQLREEEDLAGIQEQLEEYTLTKYDSTEGAVFAFGTMALRDYHLGNGMQFPALKAPVNAKYLWIFGLIALIVLLMACFNFMNLSNALGSQRFTEIGVRKVLGAQRNQLIRQFLTESVTLSLIAMIFALLLIDIVGRNLPRLINLDFQVDLLSPSTILPIIFIVILTGLMAGLYPSLLISGLKPNSIFRSVVRFGGNNYLTRGSLVFQFAISIGLLACVVIMYEQQQFLKDENLGFDQDNVIVIANQPDFSDPEGAARSHQVYSDMVRSLPGILNVSGVSNSFARGNRAQIIQGENGDFEFIYEYRIDPEYLDLLEIQLWEGRNFIPGSEDDQKNSVIVNREFLTSYGIENPVGYILPDKFESMAGAKIIGVTPNFHYGSLKTKVHPMMMHMRPNVFFQYLLTKVSGSNMANTIVSLKKAWKETNPEKPFEFHFLDEDIQSQYESESRWSAVTRVSALLAILITICGLFGLISLSINKRMKEISIRRILGSSVANLIFLFSRDFLILLFIALGIVVPIVWYIMNQWLANFAYGVTIHWWVFLISGFLIILISLLTISFQSIRAAMTDPVESLRNE